MGGRHLADRRLVAAFGRRALRRVYNQLCPSRLSGAVVAEGQALYVPMPWRGLLRGRIGGSRATAAQPVQISGPRARRSGGDHGECGAPLFIRRGAERGAVSKKDILV